MPFGVSAASLREEGALRVTLGFACHQGFVFSLFYLGWNRALGGGAFAFERADLFGTLLCMVLAFALLRAASPRARDALLAGPLLWCYAALLVLGSLVPALAESGAGGIALESLLVGIPGGLMLAAWGRALGRRPVERAVPEVLVAFATAATACLVVSSVPVPGAPLVLKFLPLGSAFSLQGSQRRAGAPLDPARGAGESPSFTLGDLVATKEQRAETARLSKKIVAGTALFGLAAGFMETFGSDPGMASTPAFAATLVLLVLFCIAALQLLAGGALGADASDDAEGPLDAAYRLALLVMMAGFLFVPVLGAFGVPGESIVLAGYLGLICVLVSLFLVMAKITGQDAALSFARGFAALYAGEMAGVVLGNGIELFEPAGQAPYAVAAFAGLAALFAYLFLFTERDFRALSVIVRDADRFEDACAAIADEFGLSKREAEVLPLALRGRTGERIAAELFISKSTVETHLRRIYAKTGTHGRQELIDLGERAVRSLGGGA
ncbi:helix-turn-helix transcriptional regulator [Gordonibacter sp. An230]|uniref:helix-turn-helix transcriptional regulator n=1 Tax=Gordonibacter sp. An230 TaxID=1965592 RepID=UPI000B373E97|nr:helix-turn-helix transcriptional regulator [Gordonibacter sp. An230]OUO86083.1 helix-turn-helix transcriptional regulator [Gordonibacter sp. An230]